MYDPIDYDVRLSPASTLVAAALRNPINTELLARLPSLRLNECHLTAGCLFQASWNIRSGRDVAAGIRDYDVFYFDDTDLSWEAEDAVIQNVQSLFGDLDAAIEVKNQARVHLWYPDRFGEPYPQLTSARDGIDRYLVACTCVGIEVATGELYAPNGLRDLEDGVLRPTPGAPPRLFQRKADDYRSRWPWLTIKP